MFAFTACSLEFLWRVRKYPESRNPEFVDLVNSKRFKMFLCGKCLKSEPKKSCTVS